MNRRHFIMSSIGSSVLLAGGGVLWFQQLKNQQDLSLSNLLLTLEQLQTQDIRFIGQWNDFQIFTHLAQSIEFSMTGYPEHKSKLFKSILGKSAFRVFSKQGSMSHGLNEPIPGAPELLPDGFTHAALSRLINAINTFIDYNGELHAHFAYGELSHEEYANAHAMHIYNHFEELVRT
ncbi:MAG: hypothetical protein ACI88A_001539 [Paraglaciecola sp.]|jgi:hypothetical protein